MPEFQCKKTMNIGYIAFYNGKTYKPYGKYDNGYIFHDEHGKVHQMNRHDINKTFEISEDLLEIGIVP